jgi:hypothetical protein
MSNTGDEAKAPMKRRRSGIKAEASMWWRQWGNREGSEGDSTMLAKTFARPFPGRWGKRSMPLMWRFSLRNGDIFEIESPRHHFTWIVVRAPCEPGSSEWGSTQGTGLWSVRTKLWPRRDWQPGTRRCQWVAGHGAPASNRQRTLGHRRVDIAHPQQPTATPARSWPRGHSTSHQSRDKRTCIFSLPSCTLIKPATDAWSPWSLKRWSMWTF